MTGLQPKEGIQYGNESIAEPNSSVVFDENCLHWVNGPNVVPMLAFLFYWRQFLAAMITFNNPAPHQEISTEPETNCFMVTADGLCKHFASATASMTRGVEI